MTPVVCRVKHDPENGSYGDCVRACIASIMDFDAEQVPHFYHDNCSGDAGMSHIQNWLRGHGFAPFIANFDGASSLDDLLEMQGAQNPDVHYMLFGRTAAGDHVVVCRGGKMVHDPAWYSSALVGAGSHGYWSIMVIAKL